MSTPHKRYGFFSHRAATMLPLIDEYMKPMPRMFVYRTPDGGEALVTCVDDDPTAPGYMWPDKEFVSEVTEWIRSVP